MKPSQPISASAGVVLKPSRASATSETVPLLREHGDRAEASGEQGERDRRPRRGDLELLAGARGLAAHVREPAEDPQVDADDRDAKPPRHQRVPELVQDSDAK